MRRVDSAWNPCFLLPFLWDSLIIFQGLTASLIDQPGSFELPAVMRSIGIALLSQFTQTLPSPGSGEPSSEQSHNLLIGNYKNNLLNQFVIEERD